MAKQQFKDSATERNKDYNMSLKAICPWPLCFQCNGKVNVFPVSHRNRVDLVKKKKFGIKLARKTRVHRGLENKRTSGPSVYDGGTIILT